MRYPRLTKRHRRRRSAGSRMRQLERKRHLGNDVVLIVFQEGETPLDVDGLVTRHTHVVILVRPQPNKTFR